MKAFILCASVCLISAVVSSPLPQSSLDHLIIPYEDTPVDYGVWNSDQDNFKDEPTVITSYNVGTFRQGDHLQVPLGASYTVAGPDSKIRFKKGTVEHTKRFSLTTPLKRGYVL